jgi:TPP-dependent pyruvate/acetoin dehydrogenase alpha subunit
MDKVKKIKFLKGLYKIRFFEERAKELYKEGLMVGALHPYIGEEAIAVGACMVLKKDDYVLSTHRGHGHCIAKGADIKYMIAELMGRETGYCKGVGGSMHICDKNIGILGANGIVGGGLNIAVGAAISAVYRKTKQVTVCFFGDGGANLGVFHEALNLAGLWKLPVIFICENNMFAATTPSCENIPIKNISDRASAYGMYGTVIDGNNVEDVYQEVKKRVDASRNGNGPSLIECKTYRYGGHCMVLSDTRKESKKELEEWKKMDPVVRYENKLLSERIVNKDKLITFRNEIKELIEEAVGFAKGSKFPETSIIKKLVYAP